MYDQSKESNQELGQSKSHKKIIKDFNQTIDQCNDYYIKKVTTGQKGECGWGNSHCGVKFSKKENQMNKENLNRENE